MSALFDFDDYKEYVRAKIQENKGEKAYQTRLAEAAGCQKSFFSQMLHSSVHLTPEHAAGLCQYWGLSPEETDYFVDLLLLNKAGTGQLRSILKARMAKLKRARQQPSEKFKWPGISRNTGDEIYYTSWYWSAIHIIVAIPKYNTVGAISHRLGLPTRVVEATLGWLEGRKLIRRVKAGWEVTEDRIYLPNTSPMLEMHHFNWRQRGLSDLQRQDKNSLHYSAVFALSMEDFDRLKEIIVSNLDSMNRLVSPSKSEEIACFTCDLFKL